MDQNARVMAGIVSLAVASTLHAAPTVSLATYDLARNGGGVRETGVLGTTAVMTDSYSDANCAWSVWGSVSPGIAQVEMSYQQFDGAGSGTGGSIGARLDWYFRLDPLPGAPAVTSVPIRLTGAGQVNISGNVRGQVNAQIYGQFADQFVQFGGSSLNSSWSADRSTIDIQDGFTVDAVQQAPVGTELRVSLVADGFLATPSGGFPPIPGGWGELSAFADPTIEIAPDYEYRSLFQLQVSPNVPEPAGILLAAGLALPLLRRRRA